MNLQPLQLRRIRFLLLGIAGKMAISSDDGRSFTPLKVPVRQGIAQAQPLGDDKFLLVGDAGVAKVDLAAASSPAK